MSKEEDQTHEEEDEDPAEEENEKAEYWSETRWIKRTRGSRRRGEAGGGIMWGFRGVFSFCSFGWRCRGVFGDDTPTRQRLVLQRQQVAASCAAAPLWDLIICGTETFLRLKDKRLIKKNNSPTPLICGQYPEPTLPLHTCVTVGASQGDGLSLAGSLTTPPASGARCVRLITS